MIIDIKSKLQYVYIIKLVFMWSLDGKGSLSLPVEWPEFVEIQGLEMWRQHLVIYISPAPSFY